MGGTDGGVSLTILRGRLVTCCLSLASRQDMIKSGGEWISSIDLENMALALNPGIAQVERERECVCVCVCVIQRERERKGKGVGGRERSLVDSMISVRRPNFPLGT